VAVVGINAGNCDGALVAKMDWDYYQGLHSVNPTNNLFAVGDSLMDASAVLTTYQDYDVRCTAFVQSCLAWGIILENQHNTFMTAYNTTVTALADVPAPDTSVKSIALGVIDMVGIFIVYAAGIAISLIVFLCTKGTKKASKYVKKDELVNDFTRSVHGLRRFTSRSNLIDPTPEVELPAQRAFAADDNNDYSHLDEFGSYAVNEVPDPIPPQSAPSMALPGPFPGTGLGSNPNPSAQESFMGGIFSNVGLTPSKY
jgi:hypothetical protein